MHYQKKGQFPSTRKNIALLLAAYGIDDFQYSPATSGIENATYIIKTPRKSYAFRVYRHAKKTIEKIGLEVEFMSFLKTKGLPVPEVYKNDSNAYITSVSLKSAVWNAILMEYIAGEHKETYSETLIRELARKQAAMHGAGIEFAASRPTDNSARVLKESEFIPQIETNKLASPALKDFLSRGAAYTCRLNDQLPRGYCHLDYDAENILVDAKDRITGILDFDDLTYGPLVVCLAYTLWAVLITTNDQRALTKYVQEYEKVRQLSDTESKSLASIMLVRHYALAGLTTLRDEMDSDTLARYLEVETRLKEMDFYE